MNKDKVNFSLGHRQRLRQRFLQGGEKALADYEFLEMILFAAHSRADVKPLAKRLIDHFSTVTNVLNAEPQELLKIIGMGQASLAALKLAQVIGHRQHREIIYNKRITEMTTWRQVLDYCEVTLAHLKHEHIFLLFLDRQYKLIGEEMQIMGTVDHAPVYVREIVNKAVNRGATGLIMVHNHPTGDPTPSESDIKTTQKIHEAAHHMGITLYDHLIIGKGKHTSLRQQGYL